MITKKIVWILFIIGVLLCLMELIFDYITIRLFIRFSIIYILILAINYFLWMKKLSFTFWLNIISILVIASFTLFSSSYFYKTDLYVFVVPEKFKGQIILKMNDTHSKNKIKPKNGVVILHFDDKGKLNTSSNFNIDLNSIAVVEKPSNIRNQKRHLKLIDEGLTIENRSNDYSLKVFKANVIE